MNVPRVISTTLHIRVAHSYHSVTTYSTNVLYVVSTPQKAPEKVVTDGYEGATRMYVQCGRDDPIHYRYVKT